MKAKLSKQSSCCKKIDYFIWPAEKRQYISDQHVRTNGFFYPMTHYLLRVLFLMLLLFEWICETILYEESKKFTLNPAQLLTILLFICIIISYAHSHRINYRSTSPFCLWKITNALFPIALCWQVLLVIFFWSSVYPQLSKNPDITQNDKKLSYIQHSLPLTFLVVDWCLNPVMFVLNQIPLQMMTQVCVAVAYTIYSSNLKKELFYAQVKFEVTWDSLLSALYIGAITQLSIHFVNQVLKWKFLKYEELSQTQNFKQDSDIKRDEMTEREKLLMKEIDL